MYTQTTELVYIFIFATPMAVACLCTVYSDEVLVQISTFQSCHSLAFLNASNSEHNQMATLSFIVSSPIFWVSQSP